MGCYDIFCIVCGCPYYILFDDIFTEAKYKTMTKWMNKAILLTASGEIIKNAKEIDCNITFMTRDKTKYEIVTTYTPIKYLTYCYFVHEDCYKYVYNKTGKKLRFDMFIANKKKGSRQIEIGYGIIEKYWSQDFEFSKIIKDKNEYIFNSPMKGDNKNNSRINKIIKQFKLKKDRIGPEISASLCKENDIRIGNDGNFWLKKMNKWNKMNIEQKRYLIEYNKKFDNILKDLSQICESSKKLIFYKILPKKNIIEFVGDEKNIENIKKYIK